MQVLPAVQKKSFGDRLNEGLGRGLETLQQYQQMAQQEAKQKKFADEVKRLYNIDVSGMSPEGMEKFATEAYKQQAKLGQFEEKIKLFNKARGIKPEGQEDGQVTDKSPSEKEYEPSLEDEELMFLIDPEMGKYMERTRKEKTEKTEKEKERNRKEFESDRSFHSSYTDPLVKEAQEAIKSAPVKKTLHDQLMRDIQTGNTSGIGPALVEMTGLEFYRNPEAARFKNVIKNRFIEGVKSMGSGGVRPNQFLEQQLATAQPVLGRDIESNYTVALSERFLDEMKEADAKFKMEEAEKDQKEFGYTKRDFVERAQKKMDKFAEQKQDELAYDIRKYHEDQLDDTKLTREIVLGEVPPDTPLTLRAARILMIKNNDDEKKAQAEAKRLGFKIPSESTYMRRNQ